MALIPTRTKFQTLRACLSEIRSVLETHVICTARKVHFTLESRLLKPGFHIVVECHGRSFTVFGVSGLLEITASHWRSFSVVDSLSWSLVVFQSLHLNCYFWRQTYSLPVVDGLSGSLAVAKVILFCFYMAKMKRQGRWQSFMVVNGR